VVDAWPDLEPIVRKALDGEGSLTKTCRSDPQRLKKPGGRFLICPCATVGRSLACITHHRETEQMLQSQQAAFEQKRRSFRIELRDAY
jgi:hypothetical protein